MVEMLFAYSVGLKVLDKCSGIRNGRKAAEGAVLGSR